MSKGTRKFTGFLWAMLLAVLSFFIIFFFFQDVSQRFFGVSIKDPKKVGETVSKAVTDAGNKVAEKISGAFNETAGKIGDALAEKTVEAFTEQAEEVQTEAQTD